MKVNRKSYSIEEDKRTLILEETYDENGNVIQSIDYDETPEIVRNFEYNEAGFIVSQYEIQGGVENSSQHFEYDEDDEVIDEKLFIGGGLYEHTVITKNESGYVRRMIQDNEEAERLVMKTDGKNWTNEFYNFDELAQVHEYIYNEEERTGITKIKFLDDDSFITNTQKYDENDDVIQEEEYNEKDVLLKSIQVELENGLIVKEAVRDFNDSEGYYEQLYEYDNNKNIINFEVRSSTGALLSFHKCKFDNQNRLIEESGFANGFFSGITGMHKNHDRFHVVHEYSE
jgi:hypothetical protein